MKKWIKIALPGVVYIIIMCVFFSLLFRDEIDIKDTTELTIRVEDAYLHFDRKTIVVKSSDKSYFYFSYLRRGGIAEVSKYDYYEFCKLLKNEGIVTIRYTVSYTIFPQYWRVIVDLRTNDTVYFSIDDFNKMNKVSTSEIVGFVIVFVLSLPLLLAYIGYVVFVEMSDAKDERDRKKRNRQKMLKKKSGTRSPGENGKKKKQ